MRRGTSECKHVVNDMKRFTSVASQGSVFLCQDLEEARMYSRWHKHYVKFR